MGLLSNVINFQEITPYIKEAIESANLKVELGDVILDAKSLKIDLTSVETMIQKIVDEHRLQTDSINTGIESLNLIKDLLGQLKDEHGENLVELIERIKELSEFTTKTNNILSSIADVIGGYDGSQKIVGKKINVLSNVSNTEYIVSIDCEENSILTGVAIASTSYTDIDSWSLYVGEKSSVPIFENIYVKPYGDRKDLRKSIAVPKGEKIIIKFNNQSRSGKTIFIDFEYIELIEEKEEGTN